jgi:hypothetical protein
MIVCEKWVGIHFRRFFAKISVHTHLPTKNELIYTEVGSLDVSAHFVSEQLKCLTNRPQFGRYLSCSRWMGLSWLLGVETTLFAPPLFKELSLSVFTEKKKQAWIFTHLSQSLPHHWSEWHFWANTLRNRNFSVYDPFFTFHWPPTWVEHLRFFSKAMLFHGGQWRVTWYRLPSNRAALYNY